MPPHDLDAERALIGGTLRDPEVLPDVLSVVRPENFYFDAHQKIIGAVADLANRGAADLVSLFNELRRRKQLDDIGGKEYIAELWEAVPTAANAMTHARLVREKATRRDLIHIANEILRDCFSPTSSAEELLAQAERKLHALSIDAAGEGAEPRRVGELAQESLAELDQRIDSGGELSGLSTGFADLDKFTGGLRPGELVVIGARPGLGKTALSLNLAARIALAGTPVLFFSLEMPGKDIADRLLSMQSGVPMHRMSRPRELHRDDIDALFKTACGSVREMPLYVEDASDMTAARIASVARRACRRRGVRMIVVDYLQLMRPENPKDNRATQVGMLALRMKQMARGLDMPVILLSQLNRESEHTNRKPRLADLRESGDVEAHADRVLLLHREANLPANDPVWPIEIIVAKNRNGPVGDMPLAYRRPVLRFENAA
jgi:replicative DNA helicase